MGGSFRLPRRLQTLLRRNRSAQRDRGLRRASSSPLQQRLACELLESRYLLANPSFFWFPEGPGPILGGLVENIDNPGDNPIDLVDPAGPDDPLAPENPVAGAIHTVAPHPENPDILFIGAVNGGIWRSENATDLEPIWIPLTDDQPSLSIGALEFDPTDPTHNTLVAGIGRFSSFGGLSDVLDTAGGHLTGLLKTTDGGDTWMSIGRELEFLNISGVGPRGDTILVSADASFGGIVDPGIFVSTDGGSFERISGTNGLAAGPVFDLVGDPADLDRFYAGVGGASGGIFRTDDAGATWTNISNATLDALVDDTTSNIELAVHNNLEAVTNAVYVGVVNHGRIAGVFRSANAGGTWTQMEIPRTLEDPVVIADASNTMPIVIRSPNHGRRDLQRVRISGVEGNTAANGTFSIDVIDANRFSLIDSVGDGEYVVGTGSWQVISDLHPGGQGRIHFSIVADPENEFIVYLGGDRQDSPLVNSIGARAFSGRLFRGDASIDATGQFPSPQWTTLTHIGAVGPDSATNAVIGATNASPIVIISPGHGLVTGDLVGINGVRGNTAANGAFRITTIDPDGEAGRLTAADGFFLNASVGNGDYVPGTGIWTSHGSDPLTPIGSSPHPDSREMVFDARGDIIQVDDGGIYRRTNPRSVLGSWVSVNGNLELIEFHNVAWDSNSNIIIGGNQDNGVTEQTATGSAIWNSVSLGDGGDVAVDNISLADSDQSIRYSSQQFLRNFRRRTYDADGQFVAGSEVFPALTIVAGNPLDRQFVTPIELNANDPTRLLIGGSNALFESLDQGETLVELLSDSLASIPVEEGDLVGTPLVYGGMRGGERADNVLYVGFHEEDLIPRVFVRTAEGGPVVPTADLPVGTGFIRDIVLDPNDWMRAFITDGASVFMTTDAGASPWEDNDITGNLPHLSSAAPPDLRALAFVPGDAFGMIVAGGVNGIFATTTLALGTWFDIGGTLPNAPVWDLDFHADDDGDDITNVLLAGTMGRGAWTLFDASETLNFAGHTGDVITVDVGTLLNATDYELTGARIVGTDTVLSIVTEAGTGDLLLTNLRDVGDPLDDEVVGRAILSERAEARGDPLVDGDPFATTGRLNLAPSLMEVLVGDEDLGEFGFQGTLELTFQFDDLGTTREFVTRLIIDPGISTAGEDAVTIDRTTLDALRVQQRLNFFAFPSDVTDTPLDLTGTIDFTTGDLDDPTTAALQLFQAAVDSGGNIVLTPAAPPLEQSSGLIDLNTAGWLNAANAPFWSVYEGDVQNSDQQYGTSWLVKDILGDSAVAAFLDDIPITHLSAIDGRSSTGAEGDFVITRSHQAGMEVDFDLAELADLADVDDLVVALRNAATAIGVTMKLVAVEDAAAGTAIETKLQEDFGPGHGVEIIAFDDAVAETSVLHIGFAAPILDSPAANEQNLLHGVLANLRQLGEALDQAAAEALAATLGGDIPFVTDQLEDVIALDGTFEELAQRLLGTITITGTGEPGMGDPPSFPLNLAGDVPLLISIDGQVPTVMTALGEIPAVVKLPSGDYADSDALVTTLNDALADVGLADRLIFAGGSPLMLSTRDSGLAEFLTLTTAGLAATSTEPAEEFGQLDFGISFTLSVRTVSLDGTTGEEITNDFDSEPIIIHATPPDPAEEIQWPHTQDNATLHDLAADLNAAFRLVNAGDLNHLDDDVLALVDDRGSEDVTDDRLVIFARNPDIVGLRVSGAGETELGFMDDQGVLEEDLVAHTSLGLEGMRAIAEPQFDSIYGLIDALGLELGMTQEELDLQFDPATNSVRFNVVVNASFEKPVELDLTNGTGQVAVGPFGTLEFTANADATFTANVALNFRLGVFLGDLAEDFMIVGDADLGDGDQSTPLAELNAGEGVQLLVGIKATGEPLDDDGEDDDGQLLVDDTFTLTINGGPAAPAGGGSEHEIVVSRVKTLNNFDIFDLADDLNAALAAAGLSERVEAGVFLEKTVAGDGATVTITDRRLTLVAIDAAIHSLAIAGSTELGFGDQSSSDRPDFPDLVIQVTAPLFGNVHTVDLDGVTTIQQVIDAIHAATSGDVTVEIDAENDRLTVRPNDPDVEMLTIEAGEFRPVVFIGGPPPEGTFVPAGVRSLAGMGLGILGRSHPDVSGAETVILEGSALRGRTFADRLFLVEPSAGESTITLNVGIDVPDVDLRTAAGEVELTVTDTAPVAIDVDLPLRLTDPGSRVSGGEFDGRISLRELFEAVVDDVVDLPAAADALVAEVSGTLELSDPTLDAEIDALPGTISLSLTTPHELASAQFNADTAGLGEAISQLGGFTSDSLVTLVESFIAGLRNGDTNLLDPLNREIPLLNLPLGDVVKFTADLQDAIAALVSTLDLSALRTARDVLDSAITNLDIPTVDKADLFDAIDAIDALNAVLALARADLARQTSRLISASAELRKAVDAAITAVPGSPVLKSELDEAMTDLEQFVPSLNKLAMRLERAVNDHLPGAVSFQLDIVDYSNNPGIQLAVVIGLTAAADNVVAENFSPQIPTDAFGPINVETGSDFTLRAGGSFAFGFGVNLANNSEAFVIVDPPGGSGLTRTALNLNAGFDGTFDGLVQFGALDEVNVNAEFSLLSSAAPSPGPDVDRSAVLANRATLAIDFGTPDTSDNRLGAVLLSDLFGAVAPVVTTDGDLAGTLDVEFQGEAVEDAITVSGSLADLAGVQFVVNETALVGDPALGIEGLFQDVPFDLTTISEGIEGLLDLLEDGLTNQIVAQLPLIGEGFDAAGTFIGDLRAKLGARFHVFLSELSGTFDDVEREVRTRIFAELGPDGLDILGDTAAETDVVVKLERDFFEIRLKLIGDDGMTVDFDSGLGGLPIAAQGGVSLGWHYDIDFGVGVDRLGGFYFALNDEPGNVDPEFELGLDVGLIVEDAGRDEVRPTTLSIDLFGLKFSAEDILQPGDQAGTRFVGDLTLDVTGGSDGRLLLNDLARTDFLDVFTADLDTAFNIKLKLGASVGANLPSISTNLIAGGGFELTTAGGEVQVDFTDPAPFFSFDGINLNLGDFLSNYIGPAITTVDRYLERIRPVLDVLTSEVPGVSELSVLADQGPVTFLDVALVVSDASAEEAENVRKFVNVVAQIADVVDAIADASSAGAVMINFGDLDFGTDANLANPGWNESVTIPSGDPFTEVEQQIRDQGNNAMGRALRSLTRQPESGGLGITFDFLEPVNIFQYLIGQTADVITWNIPRFDLRFEWEHEFPVFPVPPIVVEVGLNVSAFMDLSVGYDTRGVTTGNFVDGFHFGDRADVSTGRDIDEFGFGLGVTLAALLDLKLAEAGIEGEVRGDVTANWHDTDNDGKMYLDEAEGIITRDGPECIFDLEATISAIIRLVWEIDLLVETVSGSEDIIDEEIVSFSNEGLCPEFEPAHVSEEDEDLPDGREGLADDAVAEAGTLIIHAGAFAHLRQPGSSTDTNEHFTVTEVAPRVFDVEGMGLVNRYSGVERIFFDGGAGVDELELVNVRPGGGEVNVRVLAFGGDGSDVLMGGNGSEIIDGVDVFDTLSGGNGSDTIDGFGGDDTIFGGEGDDDITGGEGNDEIDGGGGEDDIQGNGGNDDIRGGPNADHITGDDGEDVIDGNAGRDTIFGGPMVDVIHGGSGDDLIEGNEGNDFLFGGSGNDRIDAGLGNDFAFGENAPDDDGAIVRATGNDLIIGNFGTDILLGGWGNDLIYGHLVGDPSASEGEHLEGGPDDDFICGTDGADAIFGGTTDIIFDVGTHLSLLGIEPGEDENDFPRVLSGGYRVMRIEGVDPCESPTEFIPSDTVTIQGRKFRDDDGDGRIDVGEPGLNGWTIEVVDDRGDLVTRTTTADVDLNDDGEIDPATETGVYRFDDLDPGSYSVREVIQPGFRQTLPLPVDGETPAAHVLEPLDSREAAIGIDFGNHPLGTIHGVKWDDLDRDGVRDPGEPGIPGVIIYDDVNDNGMLDELDGVPTEPFTVTMFNDPATAADEAGTYWLELPAGRHFIRESFVLLPDPFRSQTHPQADIIVYQNDFEAFDDDEPVGSEWRNATALTTEDTPAEGARRFLGRFGDETVTLGVNDLPPHEHLAVAFDLYVIGSWVGNQQTLLGLLPVGPDRWRLSVRNGAEDEVLLDTTFSNVDDFSQAYPDAFNVGDNPAGTAAEETDELGYPGPAGDSVYHLEFIFPHSRPNLVLDFAKLGLLDFDDVWGLDNVMVILPGERHIVDLAPGATVEGRDFGNAHGPPDTVPPSVLSVVVNDGALQRSMVTRLAFQFSENVAGSLDVADLVVTNVDTGQAISASVMALTYDTTNMATWTFPGLVGGSLADGNYRATLLATSITDPSGNALDGDGNGTGGDNSSFDFFRFFGDADGDRDVDFADLFKFQSAFPSSSTDPSYDARFDGDTDGDVDFLDLFAFNNNFQQVLPPPTPGVPGDYNGNGIVDTADYVVWRKNLGSTTLRNDGGISPGIVDGDDYIFWRSRFGATSVQAASLEFVPVSGAVATQSNGVHGTKWDDHNANGMRDPGEPGVAGVTIYSDTNNDGELDAGEPFTVTKEDDPTTTNIETGMYWLDVPAGTHVIREVLPEGRIQTFPRARLMAVSVSSTGTPPTLFDTSTADAQLLLPRPTVDNLVGMTVSPNGQLFGLTTGSGTVAPANLLTIDTATGAAALVTPLNVPVAILEGDLDFDPTTGLLYAMRTSPVTLFTIDPGTGDVTPIGSITTAHDPSAMAFDAAGTLYVVDASAGLLLQIDKTNATILAMMPLSEGNLGDLAAMDFDPVTGQLLLATGHTGTSGSPPRLFQVDVTTGTLTTIGIHNGAISGLAFVPSDAHVVVVSTGQPVPNIDFGNFTPTVLPDGDDELHGQSDDDTIYGDNLVTLDPLVVSIGGSDLIIGQLGDDEIFGQDKDDVLWGFEDGMPELLDDGDDMIDGGVNADGSADLDEVRQTVNADQTLDDVLLTGQGSDSLIEIEAARLTGGAGDNIIDASMFGGVGARRVTLIGEGGNDALIGSPVDDIFVFGTSVVDPDPEADTVTDSGGIDTLDFSALAADDGVIVDLTAVDPAFIASHNGRTVTTANPLAFENAIGGAGPDDITGNALANFLVGGPNTDTLRGGDEIDTLEGGSGIDTLEGGDDSDILDGGIGDDILDGEAGNDTYRFLPALGETDTISDTGGGTDTLDFSSLSAFQPVSVDLANSTIAQHTGRTVTTADPLAFENAIGTPGSDTIADNANDNMLTGGDGNDTYIFTDTAEVQTDTIEEQADGGIDTVDFAAISVDVAIDLTTDSGPLPFATHPDPPDPPARSVFGPGPNLENAVGGSGNDNITGNDSINRLQGGPGIDTLSGGCGNDILDGGAGDDTLSGDGDDDRYIFGLPVGTETDMVDDASGIDTLDFSSLPATQTLSVDLSDGAIASHTDGGLISRSVISTDPSQFENAIGGEGNDILSGNSKDNQLRGGNGMDEVRQTADADQTLSNELMTGQGNDTLDSIETANLTGGAGDNTIDASAFSGPVMLFGQEGNDTLIGGRAGDTLVGGAGVNPLLRGGPGDDAYVFTDGVEAIDTLEEARGEVIGGLASSGGSDTLDFSDITTPIVFDLSMTEQDVTDLLTVLLIDGAEFPNADYFENVIGGQSDEDTLIGPDDLTNTWRLAGSNEGAYEGMSDGSILRAGTFSQIENLTGGNLSDTFKFDDQASVSGTIDGGDAVDTLDYTLYTTEVVVDFGANTATGTGGILNIETFISPAAAAAFQAVAAAEPASGGSVQRPVLPYYSFQADLPYRAAIHKLSSSHRSALVSATIGTYQTLLNTSQDVKNRVKEFVFSQYTFIYEPDNYDWRSEDILASLGNDRFEAALNLDGTKSAFSRFTDATDRALCDWDVQSRQIKTELLPMPRLHNRDMPQMH